MQCTSYIEFFFSFYASHLFRLQMKASRIQRIQVKLDKYEASSCLFYLSFNFDFYVSGIMHL